MFGISYAFGNRGLISVDYERDWYNGMRMKNNPAGGDNEIYNDTFRSWYKGANIVRIGAEFKPLPFLAIRGGFGYMGSMLQDEEQVSAAPMTKQKLYYSAGLGFLLSPGVALDLAYNYSSTEQTDYNLYYFESPSGINGSGIYNTKLKRHFAALSLSFRF